MTIWQTCHVNELYEVSDQGNVRRIDTGLILKPMLNDGYQYVELWAEGKRKSWRINRLVLITFTGLDPDPTKIQVAHVNGVRLDNRLDNLAWKDTHGNYLDRLEHGTQTNLVEHNRKLTDDDVACMRNFYANGMTQSKLAERYDVSRPHVSKIVNGHRWKH